MEAALVVLGVLVITLVSSAPAILSRPTEYESTATLALTPDVKQGQGLVAADRPLVAPEHLRRDREVEGQLARAERLLGRKLTAHIDTSTEGGSGILRITARDTDPEEAAAEAAATAGPSGSRSRATS